MKQTTGIALALILSLYAAPPLHAAMEITPRLSVGTEYTDNVRLVPEDAEPGPESDYITSVTPGITIDISGKPAGLALNYDPGYVTYNNDTYDDYWRHAANASAWWQAARYTRFKLSNSFLKTEDPIDNEDLTVRDSRNTYWRNTANFSLDQQFGAENSFRLAFQHSMLENDDPAIEDSQRFVPSLGLTYWLNIRWGLDFSGVYTRTEYDVPEPELPDDYDDVYGSLRVLHRFNRKVTGFVGYAHTYHIYDYSDESIFLNDYTIHDGFVGFDYDINKAAFLSMSVHYFVRDIEDGSDDDGFPVNLEFTKRFQHGNVSLNADGGYNYTSVTAENLGYYTYYGGGLTADYQFTRRITGDVNALYEWRDYRDVPSGREDDVFRGGCGLSFQLLRWMRVRAGYTYRTVDSTADVEDYVENRASLTVTLSPEKPYRF